MAFDYNDAPEQRGFELIPDGTIATVQLTIRPGGAGEGGLLKRSKDGDCEMLDLRVHRVDGPYAKRKFWEHMIVSGTTDGHAKAAEISAAASCAPSSKAPAGSSPTTRARRRARRAPLSLPTSTACASSPRSASRRAARKNDGSGENYPDRNVLRR